MNIENNIEQTFKTCPHCEASILETNFDIHEARCERYNKEESKLEQEELC